MFKTILHRNLEELELRSRELMYQRRPGADLESYEWYENAPPDGTIVLEYIPRRLTYMTDSGVNFYDYDIDVYEKILRDLKENLIANHLSPIYFYNAGTVMRREHLMEGRYYSTEIFVLVDRGFVKDSLITEIPASTYLCIYCNGFEKGKGVYGPSGGGNQDKGVSGDRRLYLRGGGGGAHGYAGERHVPAPSGAGIFHGKITLDLIPCISFILLTEANNT